MSKIERILHYFPVVELPVIISEDHLSDYENANDTLPQAFIDEIMVEWEKEMDEFTEFIPCFRLPGEEKFESLVYWKGSLLRYDFILITLDKSGNLINRKSIANTVIDDKIIKKSVASIEPDLIINIIAGQTYDGEEYDASFSKAFSMEILPTGEIIFALDTIG